MKHLAAVLVMLMLALSSAFASPFPKDTRVVGLAFDKGGKTITIPDEATRAAPVMYRFKAAKGQSLSVVLKSANQDAEFRLYAPGKWPGELVHDSAASGNRQYNARIDRDGTHAVVVAPGAGAGDTGAPVRFELVITLQK
jgi:hypothetical protein